MALDEIQSAFQTFQQGLEKLQTSRVLNNANEAVQNIRNSELDTHQKNQQLRSIGEQMVMSLGNLGMDTAKIQALQNSFAPPKPMQPQSIEQGLMSEDPEIRKRAEDTFYSKKARDLEVQQAKLDAMYDIARLKGTQQAAARDSKADLELDKRNDSFKKFIQSDNSVRSALGQAALNSQRADNLRTLIGPDASPEALAKLPPQQVAELAIGMATLVKNGVASEGEVKLIFPKTASMDKAEIVSYLSSGPQPSNVSGFAELYLKTIQREHAQAQNQIEESVLKRVQGHRYVQKDPENARIAVASQLGIDPEDVIIKDNGKGGVQVTTKRIDEQNSKIDSYVSGAQKLQLDVRSNNPAVRANALKQAEVLKQRTGIDVTKMSPQMVKQEFQYRVKAGDL